MAAQPLTPALVIRWVQLRLNIMFNEQAASPLCLVTPDLQQLYRDFRLEVPWPPSLPTAYLVQPRSTTAAAVAPAATRPAAVTASTPSAAARTQTAVVNERQKAARHSAAGDH